MRNNILSLLAIATITIASITSCGKYEDGPGLSLRTKKARLTGEWKLTEVKEDGTSFTVSEEDWRIEYKKDDSFVETYTYAGVTDTDSGTWEFSSKKEKISHTYSGDSDSESFSITRLTNQELWVYDEYTENGVTYKDEYKFEKQ